MLKQLLAPKVERSLAKPLPLALKQAECVSQDYLEACLKVGCNPSALQELQFKNFLFDNEIPLYDYNQVGEYLHYFARNRGLDVCWRAIRGEDGPSYKSLSHTSRSWDSINQGSFSVAPSSTIPVYDKLIPLRVLKTIALIQESYPKSKFYVSDIASFPDPFAAVNIGTGKLYVFAVWDEPGFSG
jgi:hypothetical protein